VPRALLSYTSDLDVNEENERLILCHNNFLSYHTMNRPENEPLLKKKSHGSPFSTHQHRGSFNTVHRTSLPLVVQIFGGKLHSDINRRFELNRAKRIFFHILAACLNVLSLGTMGVFYFVLQATCFSSSLDSVPEGTRYVSQLDSEGEDDLNASTDTDDNGQRTDHTKANARDRSKSRNDSVNLIQSLFIDQQELLQKYVNKDVCQVQKQMIDMNTYLFADLMLKVDKNHRDFEQTKSYLDEWNTMMKNASLFVKAVVHLFEQQLSNNPGMIQLYRGEYNHLVADFKTFIAMDTVMQSFMFHSDITGKEPLVDKPLASLRTFNAELDEIYDRIIECCPTPSSYLQKLPENARAIANYEQIFKNWEKSHKNAARMLRFMDIDSSSSADGKKISDVINDLESIQMLWQEKKRKDPRKSTKLRKLQHILVAVREAHPNKISRLTLARKTSKEDYANMLRIWYNELLIGRVSLLSRKCAGIQENTSSSLNNLAQLDEQAEFTDESTSHIEDEEKEKE